MDEVKQILGKPVDSEKLVKLVGAPHKAQFQDAVGNRVDADAVVVDGGQRAHFKIRRTNIEVDFDELNRVIQVLEHFDIEPRY